MFDLPLFKVPRNPLFMTACRINRKPVSIKIRGRGDFAHGFAILTWWGLFHNHARETKNSAFTRFRDTNANRAPARGLRLVPYL